MLYEEYKKIFEEILAYSENIVTLYKNNQKDEANLILEKRNKLIDKLILPENITEEQVNYIMTVKDKIEEQNNALAKIFAEQKEKIKQQKDTSAGEITKKDTELKADADILNAALNHNENFGNIHNPQIIQGAGNSIFDFQKKRP